MSNRIIPKEMLRGLRKADLREISGAKQGPGVVRPPARGASSPPDGTQLAAARAEGYREGALAGRLEAQAQLNAERTALKELGAGLTQLIHDFEQGLASDVLSMSLELTKVVVRQAVKVKPELILSVIHEAILSLPGLDEHTTIHLHPADAHLLRNLGDNDRALAELPWKVIEDSQVERGGCRLETATTEVDATLETRWRRVIAALGSDDLWIDIAP